jgi:hypothetical protein
MERVFYFSGYRMTVFDWDGKRLIGSRDFQPDDDGFEDFEELLEQSSAITARLLVDMIEEDFRRESIPHVNVFDITALIQRQLERHYRDEDYVHAKIIGRSKIGRRDDRLLLSALTNTGLLAPWLERLNSAKVRLAGIWSLPLITEKLLRPVLNKEKNALIVSRQVRSALRNSFFQDGHLLLSRQAKFDKDMWDKDDFEGVISHLERGAVEIHNFLINQRIMEKDEPLVVYCIMQDESLHSARQLSQDSEHVHFSFVSLEQLFNHFGVKNCEGYGPDALFAYLCTSVSSRSEHYATNEQKTNYYRYLVDRFITQVAEIGSLVCITVAVLLALRSMELDQDQIAISALTDNLTTEFAQQFEGLQTQLDSATAVRDAVSLSTMLTHETSSSPHLYFAPLSQILGQPDFKNIHLKEMNWEKYNSSELGQRVLNEKIQQQDQNDIRAQNQLIAQYQDDSNQLSPRIQSALTLKGSIDTQNTSYRSTIAEMQRLISALRDMEGVETVLLIRSAVDIRDSARFTDDLGIGLDAGVSNLDTDLFEIFLIFAAVKDDKHA